MNGNCVAKELTRAQVREDQHSENQESPIAAEPDLTENWSREEIHTEQLADPAIAPILRSKENNASRPEWKDIVSESDDTKALWGQYDRLVIHETVLYRKWENERTGEVRYQLVVPQTRKRLILSQTHDSPLGGHLGSDKTLAKIKDSYYWVHLNPLSAYRVYCRGNYPSPYHESRL